MIAGPAKVDVEKLKAKVKSSQKKKKPA